MKEIHIPDNRLEIYPVDTQQTAELMRKGVGILPSVWPFSVLEAGYIESCPPSYYDAVVLFENDEIMLNVLMREIRSVMHAGEVPVFSWFEPILDEDVDDHQDEDGYYRRGAIVAMNRQYDEEDECWYLGLVVMGLDDAWSDQEGFT